MAPHWRLSVGWVTLFVIGTDLFVMSPLLPGIAQEYGVTTATAGLSVTVFSVTYMLVAPAIGAVADRLGRRTTLVVCLLAFAAANWLTAIAPGFVWLLASRVAAGAAAAGVSPLVYAGIGDAAPVGRRASWMAIGVSGLLSALCLGAPLGSLLAASYGCRQPFFALGMLAAALALANRMVWPDDAERAAAAAAASAGAAVALSPRLLLTVLWATALYGMYTYLGAALVAAGYSPAQTARTIGLYGVAALAGTLIGGYSADRFGTNSVILASLMGLSACLALLGLSVGAAWLAVAVLMLTSVLAQLFFPAQQTALARDFPERRSTVLACNNSALFLGISLGSLIGGQAVAAGGFTVDTAVGALIAAAAAVVAVVTARAASPAVVVRQNSATSLVRLTVS